MENFLNSPSASIAAPAPHKYSDEELLDILKGNEELSPLEAFAKREYGSVLKGAIKDDEMQSVETRQAENLARMGALSSISVLRALGVLKTKE